MDISGKVIKVLPAESGTSARGEWKKQAFVIETASGQFPKKVCFQVWNDKVNLSSLVPNEDVKVYFEPESREYNEKWYTDLTAWKIETAQNQNPPMTPPPAFNNIPLPTDVPENISSVAEEGDDLPF